MGGAWSVRSSGTPGSSWERTHRTRFTLVTMGDYCHVHNTIGSRFAIYAFPYRYLKNAYVTLPDFVVDPAALPGRMAAQTATWVTAFTEPACIPKGKVRQRSCRSGEGGRASGSGADLRHRQSAARPQRTAMPISRGRNLAVGISAAVRRNRLPRLPQQPRPVLPVTRQDRRHRRRVSRQSCRHRWS
jgi:hypothetical protein